MTAATRDMPDLGAATIEEVLAIADTLERAAVARYATLGRCMRQVGNAELAALFEALSAEEKLHVDGVQRLSQQRLHRTPHADLRHWALPETFGTQEAGPAALLTPYRALSIAVHAEERAFAFWSYVASEAGRDDVRSEAEGMACQELVHAAKLRHLRRKAYHADHPRHTLPEIEKRTSRNAGAIRDDLNRSMAVAASLLLSAARKLERVPDRDSAGLLCDVADELRAVSKSIAAEWPANDMAWRIERAGTTGAAGILFEAAGVLERCAEHCLSLLGQGSDATAIDQAQQAGDRLATQIARINARLYAIEPSLAALAVTS